MPMYALGIAPLLICLGNPIIEEAETFDIDVTGRVPHQRKDKARQSAYADDLTGSGTIDELKVWWDLVLQYGPFNMVHSLDIMQNHQNRGSLSNTNTLNMLRRFLLKVDF